MSPPNVVHTSPYVAKALGYFAKRCIDANIVEFNGGTVGTNTNGNSGNTAQYSGFNDTDVVDAKGLDRAQKPSEVLATAGPFVKTPITADDIG